MIKLERLRGRKTVDRVRRRGAKWRGKHMIILYLRGEPPTRKQRTSDRLFVGTLASSRLEKSAVKRNRMRRRCREALRVPLLQPTSYNLQANVQLLILPHSSSLTCDFAQLLEDAHAFLSHLATYG